MHHNKAKYRWQNTKQSSTLYASSIETSPNDYAVFLRLFASVDLFNCLAAYLEVFYSISVICCWANWLIYLLVILMNLKMEFLAVDSNQNWITSNKETDTINSK